MLLTVAGTLHIAGMMQPAEGRAENERDRNGSTPVIVSCIILCYYYMIDPAISREILQIKITIIFFFLSTHLYNFFIHTQSFSL